MKRVQLFEFEDQRWFPDSFRIALTKLIIVFHKMMGIGDILSHLISEALKKTNARQLVDLGSGAGGSMEYVMENILTRDPQSDVKMVLTDLYPNKDAIETINQLKNPHLSYYPTPVDATKLESAPEGLKTMINCFHHMPKKQARQILESASKSKQAILIYEMSENKMPLLLWWLFLPISIVIMITMVFFMTPFVKNLTFGQVFFTYIIPLIPLFYAWDGQASMPRIYTPKDVEELLEGLHSDGYTWTINSAKKSNGKALGYSVLGVPTQA